MEKRKVQKTRKIKERGITLIALVITIIVLLILAGVALAALNGDSGILSNAESAKLQTNHNSVAEGLKLKMGEYYIAKNVEGYDNDFMTFLEEAEIVDEDGVINVQKLLGKKLSTGNGSGTNDVYKLEEIVETAKLASTKMVKVASTQNNVKKYILKYYKTEVEVVELETIANESKTYPLPPTDSKYFEFADWDDTAKTVTLKGIHPDYMPEFIYYDDANYEDVTGKFPAYIKVDETDKITNIVIPNTVKKGDITYMVTAVGNSAFYSDSYRNAISEITSIIIPDTVTSIGNYAFMGCSGLTSIDIPSGVTSIGYAAFSGCSGLTSIDIPSGVTSIEDYAFNGCSGLTSIDIPSGVTSIGEDAFYKCSNLKTVYYSGTEAQWEAITIGRYNTPLENANIICSDTVVEQE